MDPQHAPSSPRPHDSRPGSPPPPSSGDGRSESMTQAAHSHQRRKSSSRGSTRHNIEINDTFDSGWRSYGGRSLRRTPQPTDHTKFYDDETKIFDIALNTGWESKEGHLVPRTAPETKKSEREAGERKSGKTNDSVHLNIDHSGENIESGTQPPHDTSQDSKNKDPSNENSRSSGETKHKRRLYSWIPGTSSSHTQASKKPKSPTDSPAVLRIDTRGQNKDRDSSQAAVAEKQPGLNMPTESDDNINEPASPTSLNGVLASLTADSPQRERQGTEQSGTIFPPTAHSPLAQSEAFSSLPNSQPLTKHLEPSDCSPVDGVQSSVCPYKQHPLPIQGSPTHPEVLGGVPDSRTPLQDSDQSPLDHEIPPEHPGLVDSLELTPPSPNPLSGEQNSDLNSDLQPRQPPPTIPSSLDNTQNLEAQSQQDTPTGSSPPKSEQYVPPPLGQREITSYYSYSSVPTWKRSHADTFAQKLHSPPGHEQEPEVSQQDSTPED